MKQIEKDDDEINLSIVIYIKGISIFVMLAYFFCVNKMSAAFDR